MLVGKRDQQPAHPLAAPETRKNKMILYTYKLSPAGPQDGIHAVAVNVVHGCLRFQGAGVDPEEDQRATLLVVNNLESQGAQVVLVPAAAERREDKFKADRLTLKFHIVPLGRNI